MVTVKVLKRKDASSVIVAIVIAFLTINFLSMLFFDISAKLTEFISGRDSQYVQGPGAGWDQLYLMPVMTFVLQLLALEILVRLVLGIKSFWKNAK